MLISTNQNEIITRLAKLLSIESEEDYFSVLAKETADLLNADSAIIAELVNSCNKSVSTIGFSIDGQTTDNITYLLPGTPSENIVKHKTCVVYQSGVQQLFPEDEKLVDMGVEGYVGSPLINASGEVLGLVCVLYRDPINNSDELDGLLQIVSSRLSSELERSKNTKLLAMQNSQLKLQGKRLEALYSLSQMDPDNTQAIKDFTLDSAVEITQSKIGYIYFMNDDETVLSLHAWSESVMSQCEVIDPQSEYAVVNTGLWGEAARQRKPIITNDYQAENPWKKGVPDGHVPLSRHMNLPVIDDSKITLIAGVANKEEPYNEDDVRNLKLLMEGMWQILAKSKVLSVLQHSEQSFRRFYENSPLSYQSLNAEGCFIDVNPAWLETFGYSKEEIIGKKFTDLMTNHSGGLAAERFPRLKKQGEVHDADFEIIHKDGHVVDVILNGRSSYDKHGKFIRTNCILIDVTESRIANERLRQSESENRMLSMQLQNLLDNIPDRILFLDHDMRIIWTNQVESPQGKPFKSDPKDQFCYSLMQGLDSACPGCPAVISFQTGETAQRERVNEDGHIWNQRAFPIKDDAGQVINVVEIGQDVTEKINMQKEMIRTGQLAALGELAAGVAHEINNPINGVINYAQILKNRGFGNSSDQQIIDGIVREGDRVARIVSQLLSLSRVDNEKPQPVCITGVISDVLALCGRQFNNDGINIEVSLENNLPRITGHAHQLEQLFLNILSNARYALNQRYQQNSPNKRLEVKLRHDLALGHLVATFYDHGTGVPAELIDKVLRPFITTKPSSEGTGLGLSISNDIVNNHSGKLIIRSEEGRFTEVVVRFPVPSSP